MRIFSVLHDFRGGGAEKMAVLMANEFARKNHEAWIICATEDGPFRGRVAESVRVVNLRKRQMSSMVMPLAKLMREQRDAIFISHLTHVNVAAALSRILSRHESVFGVEHNDFSQSKVGTPWGVAKLGYYAAPLLYRYLRGLISVSTSVSESVPRLPFSQGSGNVVLNNPIDPQEVEEKAGRHADHRWLHDDTPVLIACGRLTGQKNYPMMLRAIADLRQRTGVRLLILGEGPDREALQRLAEELEVSDIVDFVGFVEAPQAYFSKARLFISTSDWEGLPMTLLEALYCGANVVTTDSCSAASELTGSGRFGRCVPRGSVAEFVGAVEQQLGDAPASVEEKRGALADFRVDRVADAYLRFFATARS